jgi:GNAT superfamily N-acetyltransferase
VDLESAETLGNLDFFRAVPEDLARAQGVAHAELDGAVCGAVWSLSSGSNARMFNHVLGLGLAAPASDADIDRIADFYRGAPHYVALARSAKPADLAQRLLARGYVPDYPWAKFSRGVHVPPRVETDLRIERIGPEHAEAFGRVVARALFELPELAGRWTSALVARPGWSCFLALDGEEPAATGALYVAGGVGWLSFGATLPEFRRRGAQSALLAARIRTAAELGCTVVVTETGAQVEGRPSNSYRNILRAGFEEAYVRPNYAARTV